MEKKYYIAYGSNTYAEQMKRRCPDSRLIGTAMLEGFELEFRGAATVVPKHGAQTPVLLWEISELDEIRLDVCEGVHNRVYHKETQEIKIDGKKVFGMMYVKNDGQISPPKDGYAKRMFQGYEQNGMDVQYIHNAILKSFHVQMDSEKEEQEESESMNFSQN
ncbi:MAG: gamma-glutamylcyclotransferase [Oscillospiraceae bacterium]|nr:gamma-glutamylcyclotransferase [Oscillospiraceae bacterium]